MNVTGHTEIRHLSPVIRSNLAKILDICDGWRHLASVITKSPTNPELLYSAVDIKEIERRPRSPTLQLLDDWGTRGRVRPTVRVLLDYLVQIQQFRAADYLANDILSEKRPPRPDYGPAQRPFVSENIEHWDVTCKETSLPSTTSGTGQASVKVREPEQEQACSAESDPVPHVNFNDLFIATCGFGGNQKLGQGGFGSVYLGILELNGQRKNVAVKRLNIGEEGQFHTELQVMTKYVNENLLQILAYSCDNEQARCLICEYMSNGSLEDRLAQKGNSPPLPWDVRLDIAVGTARGLVALHTMYPEPLIHRDIKSANILLNARFKAKIGDFGIARLGSSWEETTRILTSRWCGTPVYMADEALRGSITVKSDTFSFGVVLLELLTGLPPFDSARSEPALLSYVDEEEKEVHEWKDPKAGDWPETVFFKLFGLSTDCTHQNRKERPLMEQVLEKLEVLQAE